MLVMVGIVLFVLGILLPSRAVGVTLVCIGAGLVVAAALTDSRPRR